MKQFYFWNRWNKEHRLLYLAFLGIFSLSLLFFVVAYFLGEKAVIHWEVSTLMEPFMVAVDSFTQNLFGFSVDVESYMLKESYYASDIQVNLSSSYLFFAFLVAGIAVGITIITFLDSFSYFVGSGLLMVLVVTLNLDLLGIFGFENKIPAVAVILVLGGLSYYFKSFKPEAGFTLRLGVFMGVMAVMAVIIVTASPTPHPVLYITNFGITMPILLTLLFMAMNGFELINVFLFLSAGNATTPDNKNRLANFIIISLLYLSNVVLLLMKKMLIVHWDILYVNAFLLYAVSSIVGIWGYKKRAVIFKDMLPFNPAGGLFYLAIGIVANATLAYAFITGNDPLYECLEYGIIYAHLFFGTIYFLYVIFNFGHLFKKRISIYDIVYKPRNMPLFMVRGIGVAGIIAIWLYSNKFAFYLGLAGYFNLAGDVYKHENNFLLAKQYYRTGVVYEFQNHRSNYSMACLLAAENDRDGQFEYYTGALIKNPDEHSYVNLSNLYLKENAYFQAIFIAQEGLQKFPGSPYLANNLGVLYARTDVMDSIFYYLDYSLNKKKDEPVPATNYLYTLLKKDLYEDADSILKLRDYPADRSFMSNKMLLETVLHRNTAAKGTAFTGSEMLRPVNYAFLYNYELNHLKNQHGTVPIKALDSLLKNPVNEPFSEGLQLLKVLKLYYSGKKKEAFLQLENLKNNSSNFYFRKLAGVWMTEQDAYIPAAANFRETFGSGGNSAKLNYCMALCEAGNFGEAEPILQELKAAPENEVGAVASELSNIISTNDAGTVLTWPEIQRVRYLHLKKKNITESQLYQIYQSIKSLTFQKIAAADVMQQLIDNGKISAAREVYELLDKSDTVKAFDNGIVNLAYLRLLVAESKWDLLKSASKNIYLNQGQKNLRSYFQALAAENTGDPKNATRLYNQVVDEAPYFEEGILHAVAFYNSKNKIQDAYNLIADEVQFNPTSASLLEAFALQALRNNLTSYGEDALKQLEFILSPQGYASFKKEFDELKAKTEAEAPL